ncbi:hypothetical protein AGMMS49992_23830 [Clostridia bacterium]|nr:hypothetical protein AGMMS49992_23830 [Clostridia bacterium]
MGDTNITIIETPSGKDPNFFRRSDVLASFFPDADSRNADSISASSFSTKSAELSHADKSAPTKLLERQNELQILNDFCKQESGYILIEAPAWFGKSALLSWFFLHPPSNTEIVGFFVTKRENTWSYGDAFESSIKAQLRNVLIRYEKWSDGFISSTLLALLEYTAKIVGAAGKRLVLIVDALDEDRSADLEQSYILERLRLPHRMCKPPITEPN